MMKPINSPEFSDVVAVLVDGKRILDPAGIDEEKGEVQLWIPSPPEAINETAEEVLSSNTQEELDALAEWSTKTITGKITLVRKK